MKKLILFIGFVLISQNISAIIYEDAEDGSVSGWSIYDNSPAASVTNEFDSQKNSNIIRLNGNSTLNGFRLGNHAGRANAWNNTTETIITWESKFNQNFNIYISIDTTLGQRFLVYRPERLNLGIRGARGNYIFLALGSNYKNGTWRKVTRDLTSDLKAFESNNQLLSVNGIFVRGSGELDNIALVSSQEDTIIEDGENFNSTMSSWISSQGTIISQFNPARQSNTLVLNGPSFRNGFNSGVYGPWNNTSQKTLNLDFKSNKNFVIYVLVETLNGNRLLAYRPKETDIGYLQGSGGSDYIFIGIGSELNNGDWQSISQDLEADLKLIEPENKILFTQGILLRNIDEFDNLSLSNNSSLPDPGKGLLADDLTLRPMQAIAKPNYLESIIDPSFGTTIRRISDAGIGNVIKPMYSTVQAWNADESLMILYDQSNSIHQLLDGHSYALIRNLDDIRPDDIEQIFWDHQKPDSFYYVDSLTDELIHYSVSTQTKETLADLGDLTNCSQSGIALGNDVQMMSHDSDVISFRCGNNTAYSYRISNNQLTSFDLPDVRYVAPMPGPSGNLFFHRTSVFNADGSFSVALNKASPEHASLGLLGNGHDALFSVEFAAGPQGGCDGNIIAHDLTNGACFDVISQRKGYDYSKSGTHISALAHKNPQELVIAYVQDSDNVKVYRIGHHRSDENEFDYWGEPHAVISPSGTRVLFGSDWSGSEDGQSVDAYVVELPAYEAP